MMAPEGGFKLVEGGYERLGHVATAEGAVEAGGVGQRAGLKHC